MVCAASATVTVPGEPLPLAMAPRTGEGDSESHMEFRALISQAAAGALSTGKGCNWRSEVSVPASWPWGAAEGTQSGTALPPMLAAAVELLGYSGGGPQELGGDALTGGGWEESRTRGVRYSSLPPLSECTVASHRRRVLLTKCWRILRKTPLSIWAFVKKRSILMFKKLRC